MAQLGEDRVRARSQACAGSGRVCAPASEQRVEGERERERGLGQGFSISDCTEVFQEADEVTSAV